MSHSDSTPTNSPAAEEDGLNVLLAEDNITNQKLAVAILRKQGHRVTIAGDGKQAVEFYEREKFDLILMDMQMPEMDGIEATAAIRLLERSSGTHIPIVAVTANAMLGDRERCLNAGMDDYLSKPLRADGLVSIIQRVMALSKSMNSTPTPDNNPASPDAGDVFDYAASVSQVGDDAELLGQLASVFLEQLPQLLPPLAAAVAASDAKAIRQTAHALSSSVSVLVATRARNCARKLESMGLNSELETVTQTHIELLAEFETLKNVLLSTPSLKAA
jgi:two-component system, sensor histidine kinase and response regulator